MRRLLPLAAASLFFVAPAAAQVDYLPDNTQWPGLSQLASVARSAQIPLQLAAELDWRNLGAKDALFVLYPRHGLAPQSAISFVENGGRLLIADDFGAGEGLLGALSIERRAAPRGARFHYQDNANLPVAVARQPSHRLLRDVRAVVTNHPATFRSSYRTLLGFGRGEQLMVATTRGKGRFVALADPSVLINVMQRFDGNQHLARNIVQYLCHDGCAKIVLVTGYFRERTGAPDDKDKRLSKVHRLNTTIARVNDFALTKTGMRVLAFIAGGMALAALLLVLPLPRQDLDGRWLRPSTQPQRRDELFQAGIELRQEVEETLGQALRAPESLSTLRASWIIARCQQRGGRDAGPLCAKLLSALAKLPYSNARRRPGGRPKEKQLETVYRQSRALFALLDEERKRRALEEK